MGNLKKILACTAIGLGLMSSIATAASMTASTYYYKGTNIKGIEAVTNSSGYVRTHCEAKDSNSRHYRSVRSYKSAYSYAETRHDKGTLYRSAWYTLG